MTSPENSAGDIVVIRARRTEPLDAPDVRRLAQPWTEKLFGRVNVVDIIEKAVLAVTLINEQEETMGHAALYDYPNISEVKPSEWEHWLSSFYDGFEYTALNSLFVHYFVAVPEHAQLCAWEIVNTAFNVVTDLLFIFLVVSRGHLPDSSIASVFEPLVPSRPLQTPHSVYVCHRQNHVPLLDIRKARVQDHDDVMEVFGHRTDSLKEIYGEYFLAELVDAQDEHMYCLVAEVDGLAKGFMSISDDVNFNLLNDCFELAPFHGLRKPHPDDVIYPPDKEMKLPKVLQRLNSAQLVDSPVSLLVRPDCYSGDVTISITEGLDLSETTRFKPVYFGGLNAFSIQLFAVDEKYETRSCDFLHTAFQLFPNYDFCIISIQHLVPEFPLIQNFVRVTPRCPSTLPQELYIFHRSGILKNFAVRTACSKDYSSVEMLVKDIQLKNNLLQDLTQFNIARRDPDGTQIQAFVAECQRQVVGVAVIREEKDIEYLRSHYDIEDFVYFNLHRHEDHGRLHHLTLSPIFYHFMKHFIKEILRLSNKTCLYYPVYPAYSSMETVSHYSLVCALGSMMPVHARRQIMYDRKKLGINAPSDSVLAKRLPCALSHINCKLTLDKKETVNARIVVVGASDLSLSFLETFTFCPYMIFNNLMLVSPHGLPGEMPPNALRDSMLPFSHSYGHEECAQLSLRTWVTVIHGHMTAIDRRKKVIIINESFHVPYDHLILATGQQFQVPIPSLGNIDNSHDVPEEPTFSKRPQNLFLINDAHDADAAIQHAKGMTEEHKVVVYGHNIHACCCIQTLLTLGVPGSCISWVQSSSEECCFEDKEVAETVHSVLLEAYVKVFDGSYSLACWNDEQGIPDIITSVTFTSDSTNSLRLDCQAFFAFSKKEVDMTVFKATNNAYLVYDGKLVIDAAFHTNDVSIRAAGPLTKFHRHYHVDRLTHAYFNSREVGMELAMKMLPLFDPTLQPVVHPRPETLNLTPLYYRPLVLEALLPGGYHYLEVRKPGIPADPDEQTSIPGKSRRELVTGCGQSPQGYIRLGISQYSAVDHVVCLSKQPLPSGQLIALYGMHERILNNLLSRYDEGIISDLYSYLRETWCLAIHHDRFPDFRDEIREILINPSKEGPSLEQRVREMLDEDFGLTKGQQLMLKEAFLTSGTKRKVETRLLSFLAYSYYHLPMYAKPGMM